MLGFLKRIVRRSPAARGTYSYRGNTADALTIMRMRTSARGQRMRGHQGCGAAALIKDR